MTINKSLDTLTTGIYYRKNLWNGSATVPVILRLEQGVLTAERSEGELFSSPIENVSVKFTVWGTMIITTNGEQYDFTGVGATTSPLFTDEMLKKIDDNKDNSGTTVARIGAGLYGAGAVTGLVAGQVAGAGAMAVGYFSGLGALKLWRDVFMAAGVIGTKSVKSFNKTAAVIFILIVVFVFVITAIATSLL